MLPLKKGPLYGEPLLFTDRPDNARFEYAEADGCKAEIGSLQLCSGETGRLLLALPLLMGELQMIPQAGALLVELFCC